MKAIYGNDEEDEKKFITKDEATPNNQYHQQEFACPNCGSYNTCQITEADICHTCGWHQPY